jgi:hypothetical protein
MEKRIAGLLGAVAAFGTLSAAQAAPVSPPTEVLQASSYADLLQPISNAAATLKALDESPAPRTEGTVQLAQAHHHHHHHHHAHARRPVVVIGRHRHHHHHHHHR